MARRRYRQQVDSGLRRQQLRPGAFPVDTFVQPQAGGGKLGKLAEGLSQFAPSLARFGDVVADQKAQRDKAEGERQAREWEAQGRTYREAIESGLIRPDQSPWFRLGAKEFFGMNAADSYTAKLEEAIRTDPILSEGTDLDTFDKYEREFRARWLAENVGDTEDAAFLNAFGRRADGTLFGIRRNYAIAAGERLQKYALQELSGVIMGEVMQIYPGDRTLESAAAAVRLGIERATAIGTNRRVANRAAVQAVINAARATKDTSILRTLDEIYADGDSGPKLSHVYAESIREAEDAINQQYRTETQFANWQHEVQRKERIEELQRSAVSALISAENPAEVDLDGIAMALNSLSPGAGMQIYQMREAMVQNRHTNDEAVAEELKVGIWNGTTSMAQIVAALDEGSINRAGFNDLMSDWLRYESHRQSSGDGTRRNPAYDNDEYKNKMRTFPGLFSSEFDWTHASATRRDRAVSWLNRVWSHWYNEGGGAEASIWEQQRFLDELAETIRRSLGGSPEDADEVPASPLPVPKKPIWQVKRVVDPPILQDLKVRIIKTRPPTPDQYEILTKLGIDPLNRAAVEQFIATQMQFPVDR